MTNSPSPIVSTCLDCGKRECACGLEYLEDADNFEEAQVALDEAVSMKTGSVWRWFYDWFASLTKEESE